MAVFPKKAAAVAAETCEGFVRFVMEKKVGKGTAWSIVLVQEASQVDGKVEDADKVWFNCGFKKPPVSKGDFITFEFATNAKGYHDIDQATIVVDKAKSVTPKEASGGGNGGGGGKGYDPLGQAWGNCTKQATDLVIAMFQLPENGGIPKTALGVKGFDKLAALQHKMAVELFSLNKDIPTVAAATDAVDESAATPEED